MTSNLTWPQQGDASTDSKVISVITIPNGYVAEAQKACMALPAGTAVVAGPIKGNTPEAIAALNTWACASKIVNHAFIERARLPIKARKWYAKLAPKKYEHFLKTMEKQNSADSQLIVALK